LDLSFKLSQVEDEIANSRKYYNGVIKKLNTKVEMFPSNIIAKTFGFKSLKMFKINDNERNSVNIDL
jgi:LemA protein